MGELALDHDLQRAILLKLIHTPEASFNDLWAKQGESNTFTYHLHKLEAQGLVAKNPNGNYSLSEEGRRLSAFIEGETGTKAEFPTLTLVILARKGDRYLCQKRLKEPFYGYWGFVSGKINFGHNLFSCASRDLLEEAGLFASDWTLKAFEMVKTFENGKLLHHHYLFFVQTLNPTGTLKEKTHKAEHAWLTLEEYFAKDSFPRPGFVEHIINATGPNMIETERYMENGKFVSAKNTSIRPM